MKEHDEACKSLDGDACDCQPILLCDVPATETRSEEALYWRAREVVERAVDSRRQHAIDGRSDATTLAIHVDRLTDIVRELLDRPALSSSLVALSLKMSLWCIDNSGHYHEDDVEEVVAAWVKELDALASSGPQVEDEALRENFEAIGRALVEAIELNAPDYIYGCCPSEIVVSLIDDRDELKRQLDALASSGAPDFRAWAQHQPTCHRQFCKACGRPRHPFGGSSGHRFEARATCTCGLDAALSLGGALKQVTADVSEIRGGEEHDGPLESMDLSVVGRGVSLLVNMPAGSRLTYALSVDGRPQASGTVDASSWAPVPAQEEPKTHTKNCNRFTPPTIKMYPGDVVYDPSRPCTCPARAGVPRDNPARER